MRITGFIVIACLATGLSGRAGKELGMQKSQANAAADADMPQIVLEAEPVYYTGLPMMIAITFVNPPDGDCFLKLPHLFWIPEKPLAASFHFKGAGTEIAVDIPHSKSERLTTFELKGGEQRRFLIDLSSRDVKLAEGVYNFKAAVYDREYSSISQEIQIEIKNPTDSDWVIAHSLLINTDKKLTAVSWTQFLTDNWNTVTLSDKASDALQRILALHLFIHRAWYRPDNIASLSTESSLSESVPSLVVPEAKVLEYEILCFQANKAKAETLRKEIITKWPGLAWKINEVEKGEGLLNLGRKMYGAERTFRVEPDEYPYTKK